PSGLPGRRGPRNLAFAEDIDNGYADIAFPGVAETLRRGEVEPARLETLDLAQRIRMAAARLDQAAAALSGVSAGTPAGARAGAPGR
ncbi:MAG TPA: transferrin receptor-like dimerization domain-containing protein, partial [Gemmatimonadales bacterium]|nr:transferrin receptor-like dimerization domain-containing protein [Gemmatimonadales bacterium]